MPRQQVLRAADVEWTARMTAYSLTRSAVYTNGCLGIAFGTTGVPAKRPLMIRHLLMTQRMDRQYRLYYPYQLQASQSLADI